MPDPARTGCVQAGLTHAKKKAGGGLGTKVERQAREKRRRYMQIQKPKLIRKDRGIYIQVKNSDGLVNFPQMPFSFVAFPFYKSRFKVNRTVHVAITWTVQEKP